LRLGRVRLSLVTLSPLDEQEAISLNTVAVKHGVTFFYADLMVLVDEVEFGCPPPPVATIFPEA
jgi:hypothetical protein